MDRNVVLGLILFLMIGMMVGLNYADLRFEVMKWQMDSYSCEGIDQYYTGKDFLRDIWDSDMRTYYEADSEFSVKPITQMTEGTWDCEDISHAIKCLADMYEIDCRYYMTKDYGRDEGGHVGIECYVNGYWNEVN